MSRTRFTGSSRPALRWPGMSLSEYLLAEARRIAGATDSRGDPRPDRAAASGEPARAGRRDRPRRARSAVIVLDASAVVELLLGSPRGAIVRARIERPDEIAACAAPPGRRGRQRSPTLPAVRRADRRRMVARRSRTSPDSTSHAIPTTRCCRGSGSCARPSRPTTPSTWRWRRSWRRRCLRWTDGWPARGVTAPVSRRRDASRCDPPRRGSSPLTSPWRSRCGGDRRRP